MESQYGAMKHIEVFETKRSGKLDLTSKKKTEAGHEITKDKILGGKSEIL
jgi:hypothetical protein